ncbi:MAG: cytochrome-c oxidase, cbb3-type subunit III [Rickettsiales bacterium]|nr:cytochrome-c oxidase, cbb3-type subunit III [Rickettsiales bacterium]
MADKKDIDQHTGVETTGHEWDGIKELNNPAPRWWLWVFFITCIWAFGYWVLYPAWPTISGEGKRGGTEGTIQWSQYSQLKDQQADIAARKSGYLEDFQKRSFDEIMDSPELYAFAVAGGKSAFKDNCATCHGSGGAGGKGYPNLNDDDWLWGGSADDIYQTIKYGIRGQHDEARISQMPAFADLLSNDEVDAVAAYVLSLSKGDAELPDSDALKNQGAEIYQDQCASCHGSEGRGNYEFGAPNLADSLWFYSEGDKSSIAKQIKYPKHGMMPHWEGRLSDDTIRQLTIYIHSLGGGE